MLALVQRAASASVTVEGKVVGAIDTGLLVLLGIEKQDDKSQADTLLKKLLAYRMFADAQGKMNCSVKDVEGGVLVVSQFTLAADTRKGLRPSFSSAADPQSARELYDYFVERLRAQHEKVATGIFAADMQVSLVNDGPVTFMLSS